jgi:hypothetical protein
MWWAERNRTRARSGANGRRLRPLSRGARRDVPSPRGAQYAHARRRWPSSRGRPPALADVVGIDRPACVDASFDVRNHVRAVARGRGGSIVRTSSGRRQRSRLAPSTAPGSCGSCGWRPRRSEVGALIGKIHHCVDDGLAGVHMMIALLASQEAPAGAGAGTWRARAVPGRDELRTGRRGSASSGRRDRGARCGPRTGAATSRTGLRPRRARWRRCSAAPSPPRTRFSTDPSARSAPRDARGRRGRAEADQGRRRSDRERCRPGVRRGRGCAVFSEIAANRGKESSYGRSCRSRCGPPGTQAPGEPACGHVGDAPGRGARSPRAAAARRGGHQPAQGVRSGARRAAAHGAGGGRLRRRSSPGLSGSRPASAPSTSS